MGSARFFVKDAMPVEAPSSSPPPPRELIVPQAPSVKRSGMAEAAATSGRQRFQRFVHMTARSYRAGDGSRRGENSERNQGEAELCGPRLPVALSNHPPVRTSGRRRGTFRPLGHGFGSMVSHEPAPRPDHGPYLSSRCYDAAPALAKLEPISGGISGAKHSVGFTSRYCGDTARP